MERIRKRKNGSKLVQLCFHDDDGNLIEPILTKQCFKDECDINTIIDRFRRGATLPAPPVDGLRYGDFSNIGSFQDAMIAVCQAEEMFASLPAKIRARFENDPGQFLDFADDPNNYDEMVKMGLVAPKPNVDVKSVDVPTEVGESSEQ